MREVRQIAVPFAKIAIIGTVALDILTFWDSSHKVQTDVRVEIGGVCKHVACVLGNLDVVPQFITTRFPGEMGGMVADRLRQNGVDWQPLTIIAPFALFQAQLDSADRVWAESFIEGDSIAALTPEALEAHPALRNPAVIATCTNLSLAALNTILTIARNRSAHCWLLLSSSAEATRVAQIDPTNRATISLLSLNLDELRLLIDQPAILDVREVARAARQAAAPEGHCLVTLGGRGSLLCAHGESEALYQPVAPLTGRSPVGGGDVLFASLLAARQQRLAWPDALRFATICTRRYLLRDPADPEPYRVLRDPVTSADYDALPPLERIPFDHAH